MTKRNISQRSELINDVYTCGINPDTKEIFVSPCGDDPENAEVDYRMAAQFIKNIHLLSTLNKPETTNILIHFITCGGDWNYGMAMYDAIKFCPIHITSLSYGHARSMSSIIIQAADLRILTPNCDFMIHHGTQTIDTNINNAWEEIEELKKDMYKMIHIYAKRCIEGQFFKDKDYDIHQVEKYLEKELKKRQDWYMDPEKAVDLGFADGILGDSEYKSIESLKGV